MKPTAKQYLEQSGYGSGTNFTSGCVIQLMEEYAKLLPESEPQKAGMPTSEFNRKLFEIIERYVDDSHYYSSNAVGDIIDLFTSRLSVPEVKPISDEALQTYFVLNANCIAEFLFEDGHKEVQIAMTESKAIAMVKHFLPEAGLEEKAKVSDEDIENAAADFINEPEQSWNTADYLHIADAYEQGAKDMRDNNIFISPKKIGHSGTEPDNQSKKQ